jgi:hypothetical protein
VGTMQSNQSAVNVTRWGAVSAAGYNQMKFITISGASNEKRKARDVLVRHSLNVQRYFVTRTPIIDKRH